MTPAELKDHDEELQMQSEHSAWRNTAQSTCINCKAIKKDYFILMFAHLETSKHNNEN